jgi:tetratricopeptide (TPR) repeat protein
MKSPNQTESPGRVASALAEADRHRKSGHPAEAERVLRRYLAENQPSADAMNYLALLLAQRGELPEAASLFEGAIRLAPKAAALHSNLGNLRRRIGDLAAAESSLRRAIDLDPSYAEAFHNLGIVLRAQGRSNDALDALRSAIALRPHYWEALTEAGAILIDAGQHEDALQPLNMAVTVRPDYFDGHYYRATALTALDRFDEAFRELDQALALRSGSGPAHHARGNALARAGRDDEALEAYGRAIELAPDLLEAHREYNKLAWQLGRTDLNLTSYAKARARLGETPDLLLAEANQRLRHDEAAIAEGLLRKAHDQAPERGDIANALARALTMEGRYDESVALLEKLVKSEPDAVYNHRDLAVALLKTGEARQAQAVLEEALRLAPFDQVNLAHLMLAYRETGDSRLAPLFDLDRHIGVYDIEQPSGFADVAAFNAALRDELMGLHTRRVEPFDQTLRGGTQTTGQLFDRSSRAVEGVRERIREAVADYIRRMPADPAHPLLARREDDFTFAGSWSCRLRSAGYHTNHVHAEGWISSAYYVALPEAVEQGEQGWLKFGESNLALGRRDAPSRAIKPAVGKLVLFPSYFWHGTVPFRSDDMRLTVAFDVVPGQVRPQPLQRDY